MLAVPRSWPTLEPQWMTAALARHCPGAVVSEVRPGPLVDGTNRRRPLELTYARGSGPRHVFVKGPGRPLNRLALAALGALASEARLAEAGWRLPLEHPTLYAGAVDHRRLAALVVMEDVTRRGGRPNDARRPLSAEAVASGLSGLAALHGAGLARPEALGFLRPWRLGGRWAALSLGSLFRGAARLERLGGGPLPPGVSPRLLEVQFRESAARAATGPQTVLHGDPHPGNTYALGAERTGFYDWQLVRLGSWWHDVGYFLVGSLSVDDRRAHEQALLRHYLGELAARGAPAPLFAHAWESYRATPAFGLATWLHTLAFGTFQPVALCLATLERFAAAYDDLDTARSSLSGRVSPRRAPGSPARARATGDGGGGR